MAMKFWFGKKGTEPNEAEAAIPATPAAPDSGAGNAAPASSAVSSDSASQRADVKVPEGVPSSENTLQPAIPGNREIPKPLSVAATASSVPAPGAEGAKAAEATVPPVGQPAPAQADATGGAPKPAAPVLRAVSGGGAVRLARPAGATPLAAGEGVPEPAHPVFGLRARAESGPAPEAGEGKIVPAGNLAASASAPAAKREGAVTEENPLVRPKTDQRALYYQLMDGLYDAILILDDQGHVVDCSTRVADLVGYSREEAWDLSIETIITGMSRQMFEHLKRNLAESHHVLMDARCTRKDGTSFAGEIGVSTLSLTSGANLVFAIRNVERRKTAMEDMRKSQAALDVALVPAFVCDTDGFFQIVNQALLDSFGIPDVEQAKRVRFVDLLPDVARLFLRAACGEKLREKLNVAVADGAQVKLEVALAPVQSGTNITGVAGSILQA